MWRFPATRVHVEFRTLLAALLLLTAGAVAFAAERHRDQRRKDHHSSPYINHPIALAHVLNRPGFSGELRV